MKKHLYHFILTCLLLLSGTSLFSQKNKSELVVTFNGNNNANARYSFSLYKGDTLKSITKIPYEKEFKKSYTLNCGVYRIVVYKNDSVYHEFSPIHLECGFKVFYSIHLENKTFYEINENADPGMFATVPSVSNFYEYNYPYMHYGYSTRTLESADYPIKHLFRFGVGGFLNYPITRHLGFGFNPDLTAEFAFPRGDTSFRAPSVYRNERFFYLNYKIGFYFRLTTFNMRTEHKGGMFLDLGANYHLPFFFRHVGIYQNHKDITRFIHKYNDVSLTARIGTDVFSLYGNYRLFDFVKDNFTQMPVLSFGMCIKISEN